MFVAAPNGHLDVHLLQDCIRLALLSGRQLGVQQGSGSVGITHIAVFFLPGIGVVATTLRR